MKIDDLEKTGGKKDEKPTCDPRLPAHYQPQTSGYYPSKSPDSRSPDGHLGAVRDDYPDYWDESGNERRDYFGFRLDRHIFD